MMLIFSLTFKTAKLAILTLSESFLLSVIKKKEFKQKVMREKGCLSFCLSVCLSVSVSQSVSQWKKLICLRFKILEIDLMNHLKFLFQMNQYSKERFIPKRHSLVFQSICTRKNCFQKKAEIKSHSSHSHWLKISSLHKKWRFPLRISSLNVTKQILISNF